MTAPLIPDGLSPTALAGLAVLPVWVVLALALPRVLTAVSQSVSEALAAFSRFRTESMRRRHEDRLLSQVTGAAEGLGHLERVRKVTPPPADAPAVETAARTDPPPGSPP